MKEAGAGKEASMNNPAASRGECGPKEILKPFDGALAASDLFPLTARTVSVLQINLGKVCNQACKHCHVDAGPDKTGMMSAATVNLCVKALKDSFVPTVDITGGAPEMHPEYRRLVAECVAAGRGVRTRTNLTILGENGYEDLPGFWADGAVEVVTSLPYYRKETVDRLRGPGVFEASVKALKRLNSAGYGVLERLPLNLVYNPCGAYLPPSQKSVEADFRSELKKRYGVSFTNLFTITNMPLGRFLSFLKASGNLKTYMERLRSAYNPAAALNVMCRETVSAGWDGSLYDCDFNQALGLKCAFGSPDHIKDFSVQRLGRRRIVTAEHCYGCAAGAGSSCTGTVA